MSLVFGRLRKPGRRPWSAAPGDFRQGLQGAQGRRQVDSACLAVHVLKAPAHPGSLWVYRPSADGFACHIFPWMESERSASADKENQVHSCSLAEGSIFHTHNDRRVNLPDRLAASGASVAPDNQEEVGRSQLHPQLPSGSSSNSRRLNHCPEGSRFHLWSSGSQGRNKKTGDRWFIIRWILEHSQ